MSRITWTITESQKQQLVDYCARKAAGTNELPGTVYRRLIYGINLVLQGDPSLDEAREGMKLLADLQIRDINYSELRAVLSKVKELVDD